MSDWNEESTTDDPDEGVLDPDDLDIRERKGVSERGEGRYVISTEGGGSTVGDSAGTESAPQRTESTDDGATTDEPPDGELSDDERPHLDALAAELDALSAPYGLALAGKADGDTASIQVAAGDPAEVLGAAVRWYAERVDPDGDVEATVAALLADAGLTPAE